MGILIGSPDKISPDAEFQLLYDPKTVKVYAVVNRKWELIASGNKEETGILFEEVK